MMRRFQNAGSWWLTALLILAGVPTQAEEEKKHDDLSKIQGLWEWRAPVDSPSPIRSEVKQINDDREIVTSYDKDGKVLAAHAVEVKLTDHGGVKVFNYSNWEFTEGPQKGEKDGPSSSYVYRATDDVFTEVNGLLPGQEGQPVQARVWVKKPAGPEDETVKKERQAWQGTWRPPEGESGIFTIKDDEIILKEKDDKPVVGRGVLRVDPAKNPKTFDLIFFESPLNQMNGMAFHGVYEQTGDEMKWCFIMGDPKRRPDAVAPGEGRQVVTFKRGK